MNFLNLEEEVFGLDISDLSLKIVKLEKRKKAIKLASFGEQEIEKGVIEKGRVKNVDALAKILKRAKNKVKGKKIKTKYVVCSLPEEKAFLQVIPFPKMKPEEVQKAIFFEAENYIPLAIEDVYLDSQIIPPLADQLDHLDVFFAALPKKIVDPYISALKKAGFIPKVLEIESLAIARATIEKMTAPRSILLIDLGATKTSFIIFSGRAIRFTSSIPVSSRLFTERIAKVLELDFQKAEELKQRYGLSGPQKVRLVGRRENGIIFERQISTGKKVFDALVPPLIDLKEQIQTYLDYYISHSSHEHLPPDHKGIEKVLLSGGGANLKGLAKALSEGLKIPVELANPWINILPPPLKGLPELPLEESLKYTTAIGLALRDI